MNTRMETIVSIVVFASVVTVVIIAAIAGVADATLLYLFGPISAFGLIRHTFRLIRSRQSSELES
jgi:hypothetical protein